ncbi:MAG TPA: hypothetical protein VKZ80_03425 [Flavobacterium sp.]|nr:hypothetical protein [Flavobacterium sp.]
METVLVIDSIRKFKKYSQFKSLKDFNNNMEQWLVDHKKLFTPSELIALKRLIRFSAKVHGIANAKINTLLDAIKEKDTNGYGVSRSTFKRMVKKAKKIGILKTKETVRKNGSQSSNLYIFQRFNTIEPPKTKDEQDGGAPAQQKSVSQLNHPKTSNIYKTINNIKTTSEMDHTYVPSFIDSSFVEAAKPFFSAKEIYELWLRVLIAYKKSNIKVPLSEIIGTVNKALKETVFLHKQGKIKKTFEGYFYRLLESYFYTEACRRTNHRILFNWLSPNKDPDKRRILDDLNVY